MEISIEVSGEINRYIVFNIDGDWIFCDESISSVLGISLLEYKQRFKNICKVFDGIKENLKDCDEFIFSVAFINDAGINLFKLIFAELENNNIPGKVLTSDYLCFSEPVALRTLLNYKNIETRMIRVNETGQGFHTKCYIFRYGTKYKIIIGSSNLTLSALTKNDERNNQIICSKEGKIYKEIRKKFANLTLQIFL